MAIIAHVVLRGVSPEQYDRVRAEVGWLERAPDGGYSHVTWWEMPATILTPGRMRQHSTPLLPIDLGRQWVSSASKLNPR